MASKLPAVVDTADRAINQFIVIIGAFVLIFCGFAVYDSICVRNESTAVQNAVSLVKEVPENERIAELKKTNREIVSWIKLDNTVIDYPILQTTNNEYYLTHTFEKGYSTAGSLFADYRNDIEKDGYVIVYGHNMNDNTMLGNINHFEQEDYFDTHRTGKMYFNGYSRDVKVLAFAVTGNEENALYNVDGAARNDTSKIINYMNINALHKDLNYVPKHLVLFSTCHKDMGRRSVLLVGYDD